MARFQVLFLISLLLPASSGAVCVTDDTGGFGALVQQMNQNTVAASGADSRYCEQKNNFPFTVTDSGIIECPGFNDLVPPATELAGGNGNGRRPVNLLAPQESTGVSMDRINLWSKQCITKAIHENPNSEMNLLLVRSKWKQTLDRELELMARLDPTMPGYEQMWQEFEAKWKKRYEDPKSAGVRRMDQSALLNTAEGSSEHLLLRRKIYQGIRTAKHQARQAYDAFQSEIDARAGGAGMNRLAVFNMLSMSTLRASFAESSFKSWAKKAGKCSNGYSIEELRQHFLDSTEQEMYRVYPELNMKARGTTSREGISGGQQSLMSQLELSVSGLPLKAAADRLYRQKNASGEPSICEFATDPQQALNQLIYQNIGKSPAGGIVLNQIENTFLRNMRTRMAEFDRDIEEARKNPQTLLEDHVERTLISLDPRRSARVVGPLGTRLCQMYRSQKLSQSRWKAASSALSGVALIAGVAAVGSGVLAIPGTAVLMGVANASAVAVNARDIYRANRELALLEEKFYSGSRDVTFLQLREGEQQSRQAWKYGVLGTMSIMPQGALVPRLTQRLAVAQRAGNSVEAARLGLQIQNLTRADDAFEVYFGYENIFGGEEWNQAGTAIQIAGQAPRAAGAARGRNWFRR